MRYLAKREITRYATHANTRPMLAIYAPCCGPYDSTEPNIHESQLSKKLGHNGSETLRRAGSTQGPRNDDLQALHSHFTRGSTQRTGRGHRGRIDKRDATARAEDDPPGVYNLDACDDGSSLRTCSNDISCTRKLDRVRMSRRSEEHAWSVWRVLQQGLGLVDIQYTDILTCGSPHVPG